MVRLCLPDRQASPVNWFTHLCWVMTAKKYFTDSLAEYPGLLRQLTAEQRARIFSNGADKGNAASI